MPQPVNVFMDIRVGRGGELDWRTAASRAGDSITFEAVMDCVVAVSSCPQDLVGISSGTLSRLAVLAHRTPATFPPIARPTRTEQNR